MRYTARKPGRVATELANCILSIFPLNLNPDSSGYLDLFRSAMTNSRPYSHASPQLEARLHRHPQNPQSRLLRRTTRTRSAMRCYTPMQVRLSAAADLGARSSRKIRPIRTIPIVGSILEDWSRLSYDLAQRVWFLGE